jgi:3-hydroxyacyl-[acyl-carrier-protein] dehydratase
VVYFVGIDGARFKRPVEPGDQLILEASIDRARRHLQVQGARQRRRRDRRARPS